MRDMVVWGTLRKWGAALFGTFCSLLRDTEDSHAAENCSGQGMNFLRIKSQGAGIAHRLEHWTHLKRSQVGVPAEIEFSFPLSTFCADTSFGIHSNPMLLQ